MKHVLVELVAHLFCDWVVVGSNFAKNKFTLFLPNFRLEWIWKGLRTLVAKRGSLGGWKSFC